ncbi:phage tail tape measure protein [Salmonella enterica]|nr:phage tail tape measure protein [Salmonella enterica]
MGAPVVAAVKSYASMEDAMKGVAKQINGLRDDNGNRTKQFYDMQDAIKAASEQLPMENGAIDYAALVEGGARMGVTNQDDPYEEQKRDLLAFASTAAKAATAFELPADELAEGLGKIAQLYKVPTRNIEQLGDALNYLDDNAMSKGGDIINVLQRMGGVADRLDFRKAAALGSTFLSLGAAPEIAATREPAKKESTTVKRKRRTKKQKKEPEAKQGYYLVGTDENVLVLNRTYANRSNAERAAKMQWERLQRGVASFSLQLAEGRADLYTEMPVKVTGFKQPIDDAEWTITTLTHTVSPDNGFTTSLELEVRIDDFEME